MVMTFTSRMCLAASCTSHSGLKRSPDRSQQHKRDCAATLAHTSYCTSSRPGSATVRHSPMIRSTTSPRSASKASPR